ncbi:hypothetical protein P4V72_18360 [Bacillus thuringiensis]|uniref:Uncharacterized protein n=2 Tax=Bacteria TaxID=2 RepID=A0A9W3TJ85_BACTU|nr:hypothetical protein [Bacillus thuringiensis]AQY42345.1 hypothetical protein B4918_31050 [Bacillus thuringiensis]KAB5637070.1 hypothetical protein E8M24_24385 [Bacillus thuringiensis]MDR4150292.1 hypothetical protein [Bacillus thuringiensis]MEC3574870.1 hypothetical protein [Bacillus thuringiensis]MED2017067.1 hypothetical protein [Bacillus thuringiensis]
MKIVAVIVPVPQFIKTPFELGDWVVFECKDYTMFAEVKAMEVDKKNGRIKILGVWGNCDIAGIGDKGWQYADQCRLATEREQYREERRRVFAKKKRRNNEFHSGDFCNDGSRVLTVCHQDKDTGIVTVFVNNSNEKYEAEPQDLELLFCAEDAAG